VSIHDVVSQRVDILAQGFNLLVEGKLMFDRVGLVGELNHLVLLVKGGFHGTFGDSISHETFSIFRSDTEELA
jgi:hypothetical protein